MTFFISVAYWFKIKNEIRKVTGQFKYISMAVEHVLKFISLYLFPMV
ncbi:MAG: hypothetical protein O7D30_11725 [Rickettsia endosymbiont of Ixodes persulcatus]|nr:hypothetical protein [Rickettsia endosymbiont of Ixodes persulcatus]